MEVTKGTEEVLTQVQMILLEREGEEICAEDIFCALLSFASEKDPENKEYAKEAGAVRSMLEKEIRDLASAREELLRLGKSSASTFTPAEAVLGRAAELCGENDLSAEHLCRAVLEMKTPVIEKLCNTSKSPEDEKKPVKNLIMDSLETVSDIHGSFTEVMNPEEQESSFIQQDTVFINSFASGVEEHPSISSYDTDSAVLNELMKLISEENKGVNAGKEKEEKERIEAEKREKERKERERLEKERKEADKKEKERLERERIQQQQQRQQRRKTKLGLFSYRGGPGAAAAQYFLFGLFVPFIILCVLELSTGALSKPLGNGAQFVLEAFVVLWGYYLVRGINLIIEWGNIFFGFFLNVIGDVSALFLLTKDAEMHFYSGNAPVWLKCLFFSVSLVILYFGGKVMESLPDKEDMMIDAVRHRKMTKASVSKLVFSDALETLWYPFFYFSLLWILNRQLRPWAEKAAWIIAFFVVWIFFFNLWDSLTKRAELPSLRYTSRKGLLSFFESAHILMALPEFVVGLHYIFNWHPMKIWVMLVLGLVSVFAVIGSIINAKQA